MQPSRSEEAEVFRSVKRACYAGLDSITLRAEVARRISPLIPSDAYSLATVDPDTGLFTHAVAEGLPGTLLGAWVEHVYPFETAAGVIDQARTGQTVTTEKSATTAELFRSEGFEHEMRIVLAARGDLWGFSCLLRQAGAPAFNRRESDFMRRIAPHVAQGLCAAALLDVGSREAGPAQTDDDLGNGPGVIVLDARGRVQLRNAAGAMHLEDLADVGLDADTVPYAVASAVVQSHYQHARATRDEVAPLGSELRVRGRSGRWYTLRASLAEPDSAGACSTIVLIDPAQPVEIALILTRLYGLSPREREILALVAKGESTKRIANSLGLSPYTVQEHLGNACEKVGVRSRKELLAKLFFEGYAPFLAG